jgi:hypothetical protein
MEDLKIYKYFQNYYLGVVKTEKKGGKKTLTGSRTQASVFIMPMVVFAPSPLLLAKLHL